MGWVNDAQRKAVMTLIKRTQDHNAQIHATGRPPAGGGKKRRSGFKPRPKK